MLKSLIFFARFFGFWLLYFFIDRLVFLCVFAKKIAFIDKLELIACFYHGLRLDLSMTAYLFIAPLLYYFYHFISSTPNPSFKWITIYNKIWIVIFSLIAIVNFNIYREWGSKVNIRAFEFLIDTPNEAIASSLSSPILLSVSLWVGLTLVGLFLNKAIVSKETDLIPKRINIGSKAMIVLVSLGINFLLIRGGLGVAPNNQSMAYYSNQQLLNHAAVNTEWNLISSLLAAKKTNKNPYLYFDKELAKTSIDQLFKTEKDSTIQILNTPRPNVIIFILESFTANLTQTLGNEIGISPNFDKLTKEGLLFTNIYASGNRTDKGVIATLAGFPTLGTGSIVKFPEKMQRIPAISQNFAKNQYRTSFFYGGESEFDNYKAFILSHDFQKLIDKNSFTSKDMNSKWGAYDGVVFERQLNEMNTAKEPFFSTILSLTNHEPFEVPGTYKFGNTNTLNRFKSTAYYTDSCINAYLEKASQQKWFENTLFIFIADHGHVYPKERYDIYMPERYHIPLLFYGPALKKQFKGKRIEHVGSQQDLAATLLGQLKMDSKEYRWSKNLLNPYTKPFAFFSWDNGLGFVDSTQFVTFDHIGNRVLLPKEANPNPKTGKLLDLGKAYLQTAYQQFIDL